MLSSVLAHAGEPPTPQDVWTAWSADPLLIIGLLATGWIYWRGHRRIRRRAVDRWRAVCFFTAMGALAVALLSPLDAAATALASAHMIQHVLLVLVAAPLLALSAPATALLIELPGVARRPLNRLRRTLHGVMRHEARPSTWATVWLLHAATLWLWHAAALYDAALEHEAIHIAEHATFLLTALLFWHVTIAPRGALRAPPGLAILLVFAMGMASTFLSLLLTFAPTPWYAAYAETTRAWGLEPLADQQLAGVIMWVPAGLVYVGAALALLGTWMRHIEEGSPSTPPLAPHGDVRARRYQALPGRERDLPGERGTA